MKWSEGKQANTCPVLQTPASSAPAPPFMCEHASSVHQRACFMCEHASLCHALTYRQGRQLVRQGEAAWHHTPGCISQGCI